MDENDKMRTIEKASHILVNFTDLGAYFDVTESVKFEMVKLWGNRNKRNIDNDKMMDPGVCFNFAFSCDTNPERLLNRINLDWKRQEEVRLELKNSWMFWDRNDNRYCITSSIRVVSRRCWAKQLRS